jgi:hypothetical protein
MRNQTGVDKNKASTGRCMVVGCKGKALYRNPGAWYKTLGCKGGYCSEHRSLAVESQRLRELGQWRLESYLQERERRN